MKIKRDLKSFGGRLGHARVLNGLTQAQLGKLTGLAPTTISSIELRERVRPVHTVELATALGVRPEWLETGRDPMMKQPEAAQEDLELARLISALPPAHKAAVRALVLAYSASSPTTAITGVTGDAKSPRHEKQAR